MGSSAGEEGEDEVIRVFVGRTVEDLSGYLEWIVGLLIGHP